MRSLFPTVRVAIWPGHGVVRHLHGTNVRRRNCRPRACRKVKPNTPRCAIRSSAGQVYYHNDTHCDAYGPADDGGHAWLTVRHFVVAMQSNGRVLLTFSGCASLETGTGRGRREPTFFGRLGVGHACGSALLGSRSLAGSVVQLIDLAAERA